MSLIDFMKEDPNWVYIDDLKTCTKCLKELPESHFSTASGGSYKRSECRDCSRKVSKQVKVLNVPDPPADYACPICQRTEEQCRGLGGKNVGTWCKDHDHDTGAFRGFLCHQCNRAIGAFKDNLDRLKRALNYLEDHERNKDV